jgi:Pyridoxamine 5'-phosphate oxidase
VQETAADLERLQRLLNDSAEHAGPFLRASFDIPEHSLTARQLAAHLQGTITVALATVTARGEPRVSPIGANFVRGAFCIPTVAQSARARSLKQRPAASLTYFEGIGVAVIAHGQTTVIGSEDEDFAMIESVRAAVGATSPTRWSGDPVYIRLDASSLFTYAADPASIPEVTLAP